MNEIVVRSCKIDDRRLAFPSKLAPLSVLISLLSVSRGWPRDRCNLQLYSKTYHGITIFSLEGIRN